MCKSFATKMEKITKEPKKNESIEKKRGGDREHREKNGL